MSAISWFETAPSETSLASLVDDELRSMQTAIALGLSESFYWPGSGGGSAASAGEAKLGSLRFARAGTSARTGGFAEGFILLDSNRVSLHHIGPSNTTYILAHANMLDRGGGVGDAPFGSRWVQGGGTAALGTDSVSTVTFTGGPFAGIPHVTLLSDSSRVLVGIQSIRSDGFTSVMSHIGSGATPTVTIRFRSEGTALIGNDFTFTTP